MDLEEDIRVKKISKDEEEAKRLAKIEECFTSQGYELQRFDKFSPYAKVVVLKNYKEPEFVNKYDGTGCPKSHLKYYLNKMARYSDNIPLLISTFQDSLKQAALAWYTTLDIEDFIQWDHLAREFLRQYKFNVEILPTREDLIRTEK